MRTDSYFRWLCDKIGGVKGHFFVCLSLHQIEFFAINEFDISRIGDALAMREEFYEIVEAEKPENWCRILDELDDSAPSVFEVLIALAFKLQNDIMYDPIIENDAASWFWVYIENLDLIDISDNSWSRKAEEYVFERTNKFLNQDYNADGSDGNIYILYNEENDVRDMTLWEQTWSFAGEWMEEVDKVPF